MKTMATFSAYVFFDKANFIEALEWINIITQNQAQNITLVGDVFKTPMNEKDMCKSKLDHLNPRFGVKSISLDYLVGQILPSYSAIH